MKRRSGPLTRSRGAIAAAAAPALVPALAYLVLSPASSDLAAQLLRARLAGAEGGFGLWDNWWYGGHHVLGYSVLFPPLASATGPQTPAALAAAVSALLFSVLLLGGGNPPSGPGWANGRRPFVSPSKWGMRWGAAAVFSAATGVSLFSGRLTFAAGLAPGIGAILALVRRRRVLAPLAALLTALVSPVAAVFTALAAVAVAAGTGTRDPAAGAATRDPAVRAPAPSRGSALITAAAAVLPVATLAAVFPEGGSEPFAFSALWPALLIALGTAAITGHSTLRAGALLLGGLPAAAYLVPSPLGGNAVRAGTLLAPTLLLVLLAERPSPPDGRPARLSDPRSSRGPAPDPIPRRTLPRAAIVLLVPLLYLQWQAPVRDVAARIGDPTTSSAYYRPLLTWLARQPGRPFRLEIPFTRSHWEAYRVAPVQPLARGWERQLDRAVNGVLYRPGLTAVAYRAWLSEQAVRFVALPDAPLDPSARAEARIVRAAPPYLHLVAHPRHFTVYRVVPATPLITPPARVLALGPDTVTITSPGAGSFLLHTRFTPLWRLPAGAGCVGPAGDLTRVRLHRRGTVVLTVSFSLARIGARTDRCS